LEFQAEQEDIQRLSAIVTKYKVADLFTTEMIPDVYAINVVPDNKGLTKNEKGENIGLFGIDPASNGHTIVVNMDLIPGLLADWNENLTASGFGHELFHIADIIDNGPITDADRDIREVAAYDWQLENSEHFGLSRLQELNIRTTRCNYGKCEAQ
jgi:hypothetical protein